MNQQLPVLCLINPDICGYMDGYLDDELTKTYPSENDVYDNMEKGLNIFPFNKMPAINRNIIHQKKKTALNETKKSTPYPTTVADLTQETKNEFHFSDVEYVKPYVYGKRESEDETGEIGFQKGLFRQTNKEPFIVSEKYQNIYDEMADGIVR